MTVIEEPERQGVAAAGNPEDARVDAHALLVGGAAHELNNVLSQVLLLAEYLSGSDLDDETAEMFGVLAESSRKGIRVVRGLFGQSLSGFSGDLRFDPKFLVAALQKQSDRIFGETVRVVLNYPEQVPNVRVDPQALLDCLVSACEATLESLDARGRRSRGVEILVAVLADSVVARSPVPSAPEFWVAFGASVPDALVEQVDGRPRLTDRSLVEPAERLARNSGGFARVTRASEGYQLQICLPALSEEEMGKS